MAPAMHRATKRARYVSLRIEGGLFMAQPFPMFCAWNLEADLPALRSRGADFGQATKLPDKLRVSSAERPQVVAVAVAKLGGHLFVPFVKAGSFVLKALRCAKEHQDEQAEADQRNAKGVVKGSHAAASGLMRGAPNTRSSAVTLPLVASTIARIISDEGFCSP